MSFQAPVWLLLLTAVAGLVALYVVLQLRRKQYAARFSNVELLATIAPKRPGWRRHVAFGVLLLALATLSLAMAKPSTDVRVPRDRATVMLAIDVSLSMGAEDIAPNRFSAAKIAAQDFVDVLPERINLGLVAFAGTANTVVPPTTDRAAVIAGIENLELAEATATGEAIFACLNAISAFQSQLETTDDGPPPAAIVLMSDGYRTVGRLETQATDAAQAAQVPVSTIAFGTDAGVLELEGELIPVQVDREALQAIAEETGGTYKSAESAGQGREVFADLGSQIGYTTQPQEVTVWFVGAGLILAFLATGLALLWTNRLL
ncbi:MAG: VWA domain-containing protein [Geodermatophilaceae bacterium]|nr:VWA domain-containing protein [Geodermatophilaceae bacterium]MDQ3454439.1 VWA domain-containing protein [Actinomycetota bacterium]